MYVVDLSVGTITLGESRYYNRTHLQTTAENISANCWKPPEICCRVCQY